MAPWSEDFVDILGAGRPVPRFRTRTKLLWDDGYLYVAAEMEEPHVWGTLKSGIVSFTMIRTSRCLSTRMGKLIGTTSS